MSALRTKRRIAAASCSLWILLACSSVNIIRAGEIVYSFYEGAHVDGNGNFFLLEGATFTSNTPPPQPTGSDYYHRGPGSPGPIIAFIDITTGDMTIQGSLTEVETDMSGASYLIFQNSSDEVVGYFDISGNLVLKGRVYTDAADDHQSAEPVTVGTPIYEHMGSASDEDWYELVPDGDGLAGLTLAFEAGMDLDWFVYESGDLNNPIASGTSSANPEGGAVYLSSSQTYYLKIVTSSSNQTPGVYGMATSNVVIDIDVDSDQQGGVSGTPEEDAREEQQAAIVLPNCDDDSDSNGEGVPDNWPGDKNKFTHPNFTVGDWDLDGVKDTVSAVVDGGADKDDLAELWVHMLPITPHAGFEITLTVEKVSSTQGLPAQHWQVVEPEDMVRIFLPGDSSTETGNLIIQAGDPSIVGPESAATVVFKANPTGSEQDISSLLGSGIAKLGVEGIEFGGTVEITMTAKANGVISGSDKVLMKVAPFELRNQTMAISDVYVTDRGGSNSGLRAVLSHQNQYYGSPHEDTGTDPWQQDGYEIGYAGGMPVFLVSPRAYRDSAQLADFVHNECLSAGIGVCWRLENLPTDYGDPFTYDSFGNLDCVPDGDKMFCGQGMNDVIKAFFEAQGVNSRLEIDTGWLDVKHVDEVVSFVPSGVIMADPDLAWALLVLAVANGGQNATFAYGVSAYIALNRTLGDYNTAWDGTVQSKLSGYRSANKLNVESPIGMPVKIRGGVPQAESNLRKAGAFVADYPAGVSTRKHWLVFDRGNTEEYSLYYADNGAPKPSSPDDSVHRAMDNRAPVTSSTSGSINADCVFEDAQCFILYWHWAFSGLPSINQGDEFVFEVDAACSTVGMPVLFESGDALSINHVNSLVNSGRVLTGLTNESITGDVFTDYVAAAFNKAGLTTVDFVDCMYYHTAGGNIHCGTNARR